MTAFGFVMMLVGFLGLVIAHERKLRESTETILTMTFFVGFALLVSGFAAWLWRVMP